MIIPRSSSHSAATATFAVLLLCLILSSCNLRSEKLDCEEIDDPVLPLCIDNSWEYQTYSFSHEDSLQENPSWGEEQTMSVNYYRDFDGTYFGLSGGFSIRGLIVNPYGWGNYADYFVHTEEGLCGVEHFGGFMDTDSIRIDLLAPYPTFEGDSTQFHDFTFYTESLTEMVEVPAGEFECIKYRGESSSRVIGELWMAPNIGIIKSWQAVLNGIQYHELVGYNLETRSKDD